jgi:DNA-binding MarR family transcriptional regulator
METASVSGEPRMERCGFLLGRLGKIVSRRFTKALDATGLKPPQAHVLMRLRDQGPMTQQALGDELHMDPSNLVGVLNELEDNGWALRRRDPNDRRRHIVEISDSGVARVAEVESIVTGVENDLLAPLDERERGQLQGLLARVVGAAAEEEFEAVQASMAEARS